MPDPLVRETRSFQSKAVDLMNKDHKPDAAKKKIAEKAKDLGSRYTNMTRKNNKVGKRLAAIDKHPLGPLLAGLLDAQRKHVEILARAVRMLLSLSNDFN